MGKLDAKPLQPVSDLKRFGFLFFADGLVANSGHALKKGDAVRMNGVETLRLEGNGEIVLWNLPDFSMA